MAVYTSISKETLSSFIDNYDIGLLENFEGILEGVENTNYKIKTSQNVFKKFTESAKNELWNSPEEIEAHYQKDENYQKLLDGEDGINLLNHYGSIITAECMNEWAEYTLKIANDIFKSKGLGSEKEKEFNLLYVYTDVICIHKFRVALILYFSNN